MAKNEVKMDVTVIDLGNMNTKYKGKSSGEFSSKISTDYQSYQEGLQRIEIDGRITYIGIGELSREFNKVDRDYIPQLLYAVCEANTGCLDINTNIGMLLPAMQMDNKPKLVEALKGKDFNFKYNGKVAKVNINDLLVLPEGFASYYSLDQETQKKDLCIIDIGSRTINLCIMVDSKLQLLQTIKYGSFDLYTRIKNLENAKGNDYKEEDIPRLIKNGTIIVEEKYYIEFMQDMLNYVKPYASLKTYHCIFTGGCSLMLKKYIDLLQINKQVLSNSVTSNVEGLEKATSMVWGE